MCLTAVAIKQHPKLPVVILANRDEFHNRPAQSMHWWPGESMLAGKDLQAGGTWLGLTKSGGFALLTNVRNSALQAKNGAPSRGGLVTDCLLEGQLPSAEERLNLAGFNLIHGNLRSCKLDYLTNQCERLSTAHSSSQQLLPGIHSLSNGHLQSNWPKTTILREGLKMSLSEPLLIPDHQELLSLLQDEGKQPDDQLPETGVPIEWERMLSAVKIVSPVYGTRCSTVITLTSDGLLTATEVTYNPQGDLIEIKNFRVLLEIETGTP